MSKTARPPRQIDALLHEAVALQQNGAYAEAEALYRDILAQRPKHFDAMQLLGALLLQSGRLDEGIALLKKAVSINGMQAPLHSNLAYAYNAQRRFSEGLASANRALALQPDFVDALNNRGNALAGLDRPADALASFERALALQPGFAQAWNNRACVLRDLARPADALASCDQAIALQPAYADAWSNRANALSDLNRPDDAQSSYLRALELSPAFADAWNNLGLTLVDLNRHDEALQSYERALAINPNFAEAHWNRALCLLQMGRFDEGWREYEWRWQRHRIQASQRRFDAPLWLGQFPLEGKTILLHAEQGLGDTLQFCRYASLAAAAGAKVIFEVPAELKRLLAGLEGVAQWVDEGRPEDRALPPFDCHAPLLSLPLAFGTHLASIPAVGPYLHADRQAAQQWAERLASRNADRNAAPHANHSADHTSPLKVGLVWAGGHRAHVAELRKTDARRSIALEQLRPLLDVPGVQFYSLQKGPPAQQLTDAPEFAARIVDYTNELADFADTAALVDNLDLVITVDTAVAHLAGAMGKPVWIMNRFDTCWRWLLERSDSPWYASARLFRQPALGDWQSVIEAVRAALAERASNNGRGHAA
ncbi:tetratricopeptide repeat protein [Paraburkholderia kururiensis]|uniref:Tetratricopeptide repeat protein n=1 Tax=Paraburkholderia kururiensis TaxID=984307 RepID=A0ABZ0WJB0_9BURK|nr:tetratricopeptide repeat protein [Paraburkholderia kururiensis]WQD77445.1 tetratricopeptide repeat protein [Paraburkholderia kururiensis]